MCVCEVDSGSVGKYTSGCVVTLKVTVGLNVIVIAPDRGV